LPKKFSVIERQFDIVFFVYKKDRYYRMSSDVWTKRNTEAAAAELSPSVGIPEPVLVRALDRQSYGVRALDDTVVAQQQAIADTFSELGLIPKKLTIADVVREGKA
jgi:sulfonate transport system substrate-binding protein